MPILTSFLTSYWKQLAIGLIIVSLWIYIAVLKHQKNVAVFELQSYKLQVKQKRVEQELKNADIAKKVAEVKTQQSADYSIKLNRIRDYYENQSNINRNAITDLNNRLRQQDISYRNRLSEILKTANTSTEKWRNSDTSTIKEYTRTLEQACSITTLDYNALHDAWMAECEIRGCQ